ncbi:hypothetical protein ACFXG4_09005 [Nocardia sp. NPDC059246]
MSRRFIEIFIAANSPGWSISGLFVSYLVLLAVAVVIGLVATGVQMIKRNASIAAYTAPGTPISARFHQDSLELFLATGTTSIPYDKVKDLITIGGGVFLREQGSRGVALPRNLFPDTALEVMGRRLSGHVAEGSTGRMGIEPARTPATPESEPSANSNRKLMLVAAVGGVAVVSAIAAVAVSQRNSGTSVDDQATQVSATSVPTSPVELPNPCVLPVDQLQRFGFTRQTLNEDDRTQRRCDWNTDRSPNRQYDSARLFLRTKRMADHSSPRPVRVGDTIDGQEFVEVDDPGANHYVMCYVVWPTSYGFARSELHGYSVNGVDSGQLCRDAEELANVLAEHLPR